MVNSINRWHDGTFRPASSWKPELLNLLIEEQDRQGMSDEEMTRSIQNRDIWFLICLSRTDLHLVHEVWEAHLEGSKPCTACDGSGIDREFERNPCLTCDGEGWEVE